MNNCDKVATLVKKAKLEHSESDRLNLLSLTLEGGEIRQTVREALGLRQNFDTKKPLEDPLNDTI